MDIFKKIKIFKCNRKKISLDRIGKYCFAILFVSIAAYINIVTNIVVQNIMIVEIQKNATHSIPLLDMGFVFLPHIKWDRWAQICMICFIILAFANTFFWMGVHGVFKVTRRYMLIYGVVLYLRSISIFVTLISNPDINCIPIYYPNVFVASLLYILGQVETCFDCLFSGHSAVITLCSCIYYYYTKVYILKLFILPPLLLSLCLVVSTRFHYSIDVLYGALVGLMAFKIYHWGLEYVKERIKYKDSYDIGGEKRTYLSFILWFESWGVKYGSSSGSPFVLEYNENKEEDDMSD